MRKLFSAARPALLTAIVAALPVSTIFAQLPEKAANLQVLPKDLDRAQLTEIMRSFSRGLGVRCEHCHVGEPGQPLSTFDFASDAREAKKTARAMMRMVEEINGKLLPRADAGEAPAVAVGCITCHHGVARPRTIEDVLAEKVASDGVEPAIVHFRELRQRYYGSAAYDFSERPLVRLAEGLANGERVSAALAFLELNLEFFPESVRTQMMLGEAHLLNGDRVRARVSLEKALALDSENGFIEKRLAELAEKP